MAFEQPFLITFIARLSDVKYNLAAFGIAGSFAMVVESPIIMLLSASTALVTGRNSFRKLKRFTDILNISITSIHIIMLIPAVFNFIVLDLMGVPGEIAKLAYVSLIIFLPWAASIGYRRFYQGLLIRSGLTRMVTYGTLVRFTVIVITGLILYFAGANGAYVGAAAMSLAVLCEAIATRFMVSRTLEKVLSRDDVENEGLTVIQIAKFYSPLATTSILSMGIQPFVTFFLSRSYMAVESLAIMPVLNSLVFIFRSVGLSFQEVNIALIGKEKQNYIILRDFAFNLGVIITVLMAVLAFSPLANLWFINVSGLPLELADLSYLPLRIMILLPAMTVLINFQRSSLIVNGTTAPISTSTALELIVILSVLFMGITVLNLVGAVAASLAYVAGRGLSILYMVPKHASAVGGWKVKERGERV